MSLDNNQLISFIGRKKYKRNLIYFLYIVSFGTLFIISRLEKRFKIFIESKSCSLEEADLVILKDQYGTITLIDVEVIRVKFTLNLKRYIRNKKCKIIDTHYGRFIYDYVMDKYVYPRYKSNHSGRDFDNIYQDKILMGRDEENAEIYEKSIIFGKNSENIKIISIYEILLSNIIEPYFLWEVMSCILYISINYTTYLYFIAPVYLIMLFLNIYSCFSNRWKMIASLRNRKVSVLRGGIFQKIDDELLLPGDIIKITATDDFCCDAEILKGDVITDESFLTGEAVPICKDMGDVVFSGTKIIRSSLSQTSLKNFKIDNYVKVKNLIKKSAAIENQKFKNGEFKLDEVAIGIVLKTGKQTKKGTILRSFAARKPSTNDFETKTKIVIKYLIRFAVFLCIILTAYLSKKIGLKDSFQYTFDMTLTFFSPALYTCLQIGIQYSKSELNKKTISVADNSRIITAGQVDVILFDKTGTLTELGVDITCFDTIQEAHDRVTTMDRISRTALSTCHHVIEIENQYSGDVLDMKMFLFSQSRIYHKEGKRFIEIEVENKYNLLCKEYSVNEGHTTLIFNLQNGDSFEQEYPEDIFEIVKIYEFDLYLKRLSVVVKDFNNNYFLFAKGAPDTVGKVLAKKPKNYHEHYKKYGIQGFRVLTVAYKQLDEFTGKRALDEKNLEFLGFLIFANKLKDESFEVIRQLKEAGIGTKMCTGDNILTAISVAKECGMIEASMPVLFPAMEDGCKSHYDVDWLCIANEDYIFDKYRMQLYSIYDRETTYDFIIAIEANEYVFFKGTAYHDLIMKQGMIFARFNPDLKKELVEEYSKNGMITMFCGDGANDTGALCSADVGVSLASNQGSLASPFNSVSISSVLDIIKEGRSALCMSSSQFKYVLYSQILAGIQILVLLPFLSFPADFSTLVNDTMSCYVLGNSLSLFKCSNIISKQRFDPKIIQGSLEIALELFIVGLTYFSFIFNIDEFVDQNTVTFSSKRSTFIFFSTCFLLIIKTYKYAYFGVYRENRNKNKIFLAHLIGCLFLFFLILFGYFLQNDFIISKFSFVNLSDSENKLMILNIFLTFFISQLPYNKIIKLFF